VRAQTHWLSVKTTIAAKPADSMSGTMCSAQAALPHTSARGGGGAAIRNTATVARRRQFAPIIEVKKPIEERVRLPAEGQSLPPL